MAAPKHTNGREMAVINLNGVDVRPVDTYWVTYNPEGLPSEFRQNDVNIRDNVARAARVMFFGNTAAIEQLNAGWRIRLVGKTEFLTKIAPLMA